MDTKSASISHIGTLARTLWGEARGEGALGMAAVALVIVNRTKKGGWWGNNIEGVCLKPKQFSCWNEDDLNRKKLLGVGNDSERFATAKVVAELATAGALADFTGGATHYHTHQVKPRWADGRQPCFSLGSHIFYDNI